MPGKGTSWRLGVGGGGLRGGWREKLEDSGQERKWSGILNTESQPVGDRKEKRRRRRKKGGRSEGELLVPGLRLGMRKGSGLTQQVTFKDPAAVKWRVTQA